MTAGTGKEWNAEVYHRISRPQQTWGAQVLDRLPLRGDETVLDAGCGSGILTGELLSRLPNGRVIALDRSENMLAQAREHLEPLFPGQVTYIAADLGAIDEAGILGPVDAIFSTATFHWIHDHDRMFRGLAALLKPGGLLIAQCGGGPNIARILGRAETLMHLEPFAPHFADYVIPMHFAGPEITAERLARSGFTSIRTWLTEAPTVLDDEPTYREFLTNVIFHHFLEQLPDPALQRDFIERLVEPARTDDPPFSLDYWRLNIEAERAAEERPSMQSTMSTDPRIRNAAKTQTILGAVVKDVDQSLATGPRDGADGWTTLEVLCHLRDFEQIWQTRANLILSEDRPDLPKFDVEGLVIERAYAQQEFTSVWAERTRLRQESLAMLDGLTEEQWSRTGNHPRYGEMSISDLARQLTTHDVDHIEQIVRILAGAER